MRIATALGSLLGKPMVPAIQAEPRLEIDAALRPEGKSGPLVRSLAAYEEYYRRWSQIWEQQALLRATPMAGSEELAEDFMAMIDPLRYEQAMGEEQVREIRRIKARVEAERLPRGAEPERHLKLGRGLTERRRMAGAAAAAAACQGTSRPAHHLHPAGIGGHRRGRDHPGRGRGTA